MDKELDKTPIEHEREAKREEELKELEQQEEELEKLLLEHEALAQTEGT